MCQNVLLKGWLALTRKLASITLIHLLVSVAKEMLLHSNQLITHIIAMGTLLVLLVVMLPQVFLVCRFVVTGKRAQSAVIHL
jgi:hypothetical protein